MTGPALVRTGPITSPAPQPPNVSKGCGISVTPAFVPAHVVHRVLEWAPPGAPPTAMILSPSLAIDCHRASNAYPVCGTSRTSLPDPPGAIRSSRGFTLPVGAYPPTSSVGPDAVRVTGSTPRGSITRDHVSVGPLTFGLAWLREARPGFDVQPAATSRVTRPTDTIPRRRNPAGPDGPCLMRPEPALKYTPAPQPSQHNRLPCQSLVMQPILSPEHVAQKDPVTATPPVRSGARPRFTP